jgi:hypothetical protein
VHLVPQQRHVAVGEPAQPPVHRQVGRHRDVHVHRAGLEAEAECPGHLAQVRAQAALEPELEIGVDQAGHPFPFAAFDNTGDGRDSIVFHRAAVAAIRA